MAKRDNPHQSQLRIDADQPRAGEDACVHADGTITVRMINNFGNQRLFASIFDFSLGGGLSAPLSTGLLTNTPSSGVSTLDLNVGKVAMPAPPKPDKVIQIYNEDTGDTFGYRFRAIYCGSGSSGSGSHALSSQRCRHCKEGQPAPVTLKLQLEGAVQAGTCGNVEALHRPILLRHTNACTWLSEPIDLGSRDRAHGIWTLEKASARSWKLTLRRGKSKLVATYRSTTKGKDCSFPVTLQRKGEGKGEFTHWPETATLHPG